MKKMIAALCALSLVTAMGATAFAADDNIALGKTPMVSIENTKPEDANGSYEAAKALDGNRDTRWSLTKDDTKMDANGVFGADIWFGVDLGANAKIDAITIVWDTAGADHSEEGFTLQYCTENPDSDASWKDITLTDAKYDQEVTNGKNSKGYVDELKFDEIEARYVRVVVHKATNKNGEYKSEPSIWEFEVYGTMSGDGATQTPGDDTQTPDDGKDDTPKTGVEFPAVVAMVAVAAAVSFGMARAAKKAR